LKDGDLLDIGPLKFRFKREGVSVPSRAQVSVPAQGEQAEVLCGGCRTPLGIPKSHINQRVRCSLCHSVFVAVPSSPRAATEQVQIACAACRQPLKVQRAHLQQKIRCPTCQTVFVPSQKSSSPLPGATAATAGQPAPVRRDNAVSPPVPVPPGQPPAVAERGGPTPPSRPPDLPVPPAPAARSQSSLPAARAASEPARKSTIEEQLAEVLSLRAEAISRIDGGPSANGSGPDAKFLSLELRRWQLEVALQQQVHAGLSLAKRDRFGRNRLGSKPQNLLLLPAGISVLGIPCSLGICGSNPFRLMGIPAAVPHPILQEKAAVALRSLKSGAVPAGCVAVGYQDFLPKESRYFTRPIKEVHKGGKERLLRELLWLHLPDKVFEAVQNAEGLTSPLTASLLAQMSQQASGRSKTLILHALAVVILNIAITRELAFATGRLACGFGYWELTLSIWRETLGADFWEYVKQRAIVNGVDPAEEAGLRTDFPMLLTGIVAGFAKAYGRAGKDVASHRLLSVIHRAGLPEPAREESLHTVVRAAYC
jgi:LSD1 subclass zinc finger protein